jgi:hypothetical protein
MIISTNELKEKTGSDYYCGRALHGRFAYKFFKDTVSPLGNIVTFRSRTEVELAGMIDLEDVLNKDFIYSDDMVHFLYEIPMLSCPFGAVAFQRLYNTQLAEILSKKYLNCRIEMKGDDIMVHKSFAQRGVEQPYGKASVSIVYIKQGVALGHTGINVVAGDRAPVFAYSTNLADNQCLDFMRDGAEKFSELTHSLFVAGTKVVS